MQDKSIILFIYLRRTSFVNADLEILKKHYDVYEFCFFSGVASNFALPFIWIKQFFWLLIYVGRAKGIFGWFVDYHLLIPAFFCKILRLPFAVVMGGTDAMNIPEWKHGVFSSAWRSKIAKFVYKSVDLLLPVSGTLISSENNITYQGQETEFGLKKELGDLPKAKIYPLPTGYDSNFWEFQTPERKPVVSTVAFIDTEKRIWIKGIDIFLKVAEARPDFNFKILGIRDSFRKELISTYNVPENVELLSPASLNELLDFFNETSIYLQLSRIEGLPNVLCEAMLCGCVPIGTRVFGIPEIISEPENLIDKMDVQLIAQKIIELHNKVTVSDRNEIRNSIAERFTKGKREEKLKELLEELITS